MMTWVIIKVALRSLWANRLRSFLAMLGIIIGVCAVIFVLSLVAGAERKVMGQISAMGTDLLIVRPGQSGRGGVFTGSRENLKLDDAMAILKEVPNVREVAPVVRGGVQLKYFQKNANSTLLGTSVTYFPIRDFAIERGRPFNDAQVDSLSRVAVLGSTTAEKLFGSIDPIDEVIKINGMSFRVIGVLRAKGDQGFFNLDDQVIVPYSTAMQQVLGVSSLREIDVRATARHDLTQVQEKITTLLRKRHRIQQGFDDDFEVHNIADIQRAASTINQILTLLAGGIASISLLVGGIGIMNVMLVSVTERTREIGVRKAIGAKDRDILRQFLIEAMLLSGVGGLIGLGIGVGMASMVAVVTSFEAVVHTSSIPLAVGFAAGVGIFFGYYPALRAARLDPIEALRYE